MNAADEILIEMIAAIDRFGEFCRTGREWPDDLRVNGVVYKPVKWQGRSPTEAKAKAFYRGLLKLERDGLLVRVVSGARTTHVQPTPAGLRAAIALTRHARPDVADVALALSRVEWADDALREAARA